MDIESQRSLELTTFVQLCLNGNVLEEYEIRSPVISIGRSPDCDITIDNAAVSSFHALMSQRDGKLFVEDAASTNGVMVDGAKAQTVELAPGESVQIGGKYSLRLVKAPTGIPSQISSTHASLDDIQKDTVLVDTSTLAKLSNSLRPAYLTVSLHDRATWICLLDKPSVAIGRKRSCQIRVGGWFAPATVATIDRRKNGYFLKVLPGRDVELDGQPVNGEQQLQEGSRLSFQDLCMVFHERTNAKR
jgi:pSer/pThr/pTyr-binding forkhead associated (FHA) protein